VAVFTRFALLSLFFLYITEIIPQNDFAVTCFVALYAFFSGYLAVFSYQLAQELCADDASDKV
jgi:hypothetical protein